MPAAPSLAAESLSDQFGHHVTFFLFGLYVTCPRHALFPTGVWGTIPVESLDKLAKARKQGRTNDVALSTRKVMMAAWTTEPEEHQLLLPSLVFYPHAFLHSAPISRGKNLQKLPCSFHPQTKGVSLHLSTSSKIPTRWNFKLEQNRKWGPVR